MIAMRLGLKLTLFIAPGREYNPRRSLCDCCLDATLTAFVAGVSERKDRAESPVDGMDGQKLEPERQQDAWS